MAFLDTTEMSYVPLFLSTQSRPRFILVLPSAFLSKRIYLRLTWWFCCAFWLMIRPSPAPGLTLISDGLHAQFFWRSQYHYWNFIHFLPWPLHGTVGYEYHWYWSDDYDESLTTAFSRMVSYIGSPAIHHPLNGRHCSKLMHFIITWLILSIIVNISFWPPMRFDMLNVSRGYAFV